MKINGRIVGRTAPKIQLCPDCGRMRCWHPSGRLYQCNVTRDVLDSLRAYRAANGVRWKSALVKLWAGNEPLPIMLLKAKELIGPRRLYKIKLGD